jgi:hypothetical protein
MVRVLVAIGNKDEAVAAFENLTTNLIDVHTARAFFKDFPVGGHFLKRDLSVR